MDTYMHTDTEQIGSIIHIIKVLLCFIDLKVRKIRNEASSLGGKSLQIHANSLYDTLAHLKKNRLTPQTPPEALLAALRGVRSTRTWVEVWM